MRPKTLSGALASVLVAVALAFTHGDLLRPHAPWLAAACLLFAALMQVASNFINDYMDHRDGIDTSERLGPERACQQGWISPTAMLRGIALCIGLALFVGLLLLLLVLQSSRYATANVLAGLTVVGLACVLAAFAYSRWFSRWGLGDVLVLLFFGIVPTVGTYFVLTDVLNPAVFVLGLALGFAIDALLVVNNFRDRHTDRVVGKRTLINLLPTDRAAWSVYPAVGIVAVLLLFVADVLLHARLTELSWFSLIYLGHHFKSARDLWHIREGRALNAVLGSTSIHLLLLTALVVLALWGESC